MEKDFTLEIYKMFRSEMYDSHKLHRESLQNFLAFTVAVLGATIAGSMQIRGIGLIGIILLVGPMLNIFICLLAIQTCDRFYLGIAERITIIAKLESMLGLRTKVDLKMLAPEKQRTKSKDDPFAFHKDSYLLPDRWITLNQLETSGDFIRKQMNGGVNRLVRLTFLLLIAVNGILGAAIVLVALS